ncbi:AbrB family transcriptional regulator [Halobacillus litoralis]|uniref:AbrB family transcriptional regulator n=1 Tax=Halobacillus litoralis TaxID=45668 RepID=UPI001CD2AEED|nr:AbrB family transcriptional regulator [Halobacillus litoralis]MCA0968967.1 AbrB family transcriptional regulator [Halobacillus litoralis]
MRIAITYGVAVGSGLLFSFLHIPLAWILGPVTGLFLYKVLSHQETAQFPEARNAAFSVLGIQIGLTFTAETFSLVLPYFFPYTLLSMIMIAVSLVCAYGIARRTALNYTTSLIGAAPGGLSAMMAVSDSFKGNTVLVTIFHTIRLLSVLFIVPFLASRWFEADGTSEAADRAANGPLWTIAVYVVLFLVSYKVKDYIPAALVIIPMLVVGGIQSAGILLYEWPTLIFYGAQVIIGVHLGHSITIEDLKAAGNYSFYYFGLALMMIATGCLAGVILSAWTGMGTLTALLALAPGGLVEMSITAGETGAEPSIVSSLQTIRLLTIVLFLPLLFKWLLPKLK